MLILALILTGIGAAMSLNMRIIPNPGDGVVQAIADCIHKSVGFTKICFDVFNVTVTICISLLCRGHLIGIGIGTVCAVIGVGRTIAVFNHFTKEKMTELSEKPFRAKQLYDWMHVKLAGDYDEMTNLSAALRNRLKEEYPLTTLRVVREQTSAVDGTKKFLIALPAGDLVESVWMQN